jgi:hypothetical protein
MIYYIKKGLKMEIELIKNVSRNEFDKIKNIVFNVKKINIFGTISYSMDTFFYYNLFTKNKLKKQELINLINFIEGCLETIRRI